MTHFIGIVVGDGLDEQLAPYDENISVARYKQYVEWPLDDPDKLRPYICFLAEHEGVDPNDLAALEQLLVEKGHGGRDEDGRFFEWSEYNPKSKWDWYVPGGRWDDWCQSYDFSPHTKVSDVPWEKLEYMPSVVVEDGEWMESGVHGWFGMFEANDEADDWDEEWRAYFKELSQNKPDTTVTFVDFHI